MRAPASGTQRCRTSRRGACCQQRRHQPRAVGTRGEPASHSSLRRESGQRGEDTLATATSRKSPFLCCLAMCFPALAYSVMGHTFIHRSSTLTTRGLETLGIPGRGLTRSQSLAVTAPRGVKLNQRPSVELHSLFPIRLCQDQAAHRGSSPSSGGRSGTQGESRASVVTDNGVDGRDPPPRRLGSDGTRVARRGLARTLRLPSRFRHRGQCRPRRGRRERGSTLACSCSENRGEMANAVAQNLSQTAA